MVGNPFLTWLILLNLFSPLRAEIPFLKYHFGIVPMVPLLMSTSKDFWTSFSHFSAWFSCDSSGGIHVPETFTQTSTGCFLFSVGVKGLLFSRPLLPYRALPLSPFFSSVGRPPNWCLFSINSARVPPPQPFSRGFSSRKFAPLLVFP